MPKISVLLPVYNAYQADGSWFKKAIDSILNQSFADLELIIINDGSTDRSKDILSDYTKQYHKKIKLIENPENIGISKSLNIGIKCSKSEFIARQDADDYSTLDRLEIQYNLMIRNRHLSVVGSSYYIIDEEDKILKLEEMPSGQGIHDSLPYGCSIGHGTVLMKKAHLIAVGMYDQKNEYPYAEDYDLWTRFHLSGFRMDNISKPLYYHRNHATKCSRKFYDLQMESVNKIKFRFKKG